MLRLDSFRTRDTKMECPGIKFGPGFESRSVSLKEIKSRERTILSASERVAKKISVRRAELQNLV